MDYESLSSKHMIQTKQSKILISQGDMRLKTQKNLIDVL